MYVRSVYCAVWRQAGVAPLNGPCRHRGGHGTCSPPGACCRHAVCQWCRCVLLVAGVSAFNVAYAAVGGAQ